MRTSYFLQLWQIEYAKNKSVEIYLIKEEGIKVFLSLSSTKKRSLEEICLLDLCCSF